MHESEEIDNVNPHESERSAGDTGRLPRELQSFEAALAQLRPSPAAIDRDRLMFLAGQASARREALAEHRGVLQGWFWPASSAAMTAAAAALLFMLMMRSPVASEGAAHKNIAAPDNAPTQDLVEQSPEVSSLGWRKRITDELLSSDSLAHARAELLEYSPADADEEILSSRSYKQLLDEAGDFRRLPRTSHSPKSSG